MKTETVSRILLTVVVLALLSGVGYWWVNDKPIIFFIGIGVALVCLWWIWFRSAKNAATAASTSKTSTKKK